MKAVGTVDLGPRGCGPARALGLLLAALVVTLASALPARADPPGRVGRIAELVGPVWQLDVEANQWVEAARNQPVVGGDRLRTDAGARAVVQIGSATLRLAGGSEVEWLRLDDERVQMRLHGGSIGLRVRSADVAREFEVLASPGGYRPRVAGHYRVDQLDGASAGEALVGEMVFETDDSLKRVDAGQRFEFWQRGDPPATYHASVATTHDDFGLWLLAEERREPREAVATRYVSPEMTGWEDLDRYGRWDRHPEYGVVWLPWSVTVGWAPYRYGRWAWVRPWGWTWIDDMPWGFAPFHYGRWVWWGGRWAWAPGSWVARPVYAPALVGWFGAPNVSIGISIGAGPWVGWVPLAPRDVYRPWYPVTPRHPHYVPPHVPGPRPPARQHAAPYAYLDVPGAVTAVSPDVLSRRQPIVERDLRRLDPGTVRRIADTPDAAVPPPRPVLRTRPDATPGVDARAPAPSAREPGWDRRDRMPSPPAREPGSDRGERRDGPPARDERDRRERRDGPGDQGGRDSRPPRDGVPAAPTARAAPPGARPEVPSPSGVPAVPPASRPPAATVPVPRAPAVAADPARSGVVVGTPPRLPDTAPPRRPPEPLPTPRDAPRPVGGPPHATPRSGAAAGAAAAPGQGMPAVPAVPPPATDAPSPATPGVKVPGRPDREREPAPPRGEPRARQMEQMER